MAEQKKHDAIQGEILHEYDGILEADNLLPRWWLATFYGTIFFSAGYWFYYEAYAIGQNPREQYDAVMAERAASGADVTDELLAGLGGEAERVSAGQALYATNCAVCHGQAGEGNIGPNLTDNAWIHGASPRDIYTTVQNGVGTAGMPAWGQTLGSDGVLNAVAFVLSIQNTNRPGRPPQGEVVGGPAPSEGATPTEGVAPTEGAAPSEGAAPTEGAAPSEGAAPTQGATPSGAAPVP